MQYSLNEITLLPSYYPTDIDSRAKVNPFVKDSVLPIFVAPMTSVINENNYLKFQSEGFIPILPRNCEFSYDLNAVWQSVSLQKFEELINSDKSLNGFQILIDIANGHIQKLYDLVKQAKSKFPGVIIMVGNIAHPGLYSDCCEAGVDYVRVGIGGGSVCSTSVQCGIHTSHQWFIEEVKKRSWYDKSNRTKLIADGGINTLDKAIKALGIGYDYVMMGKCFAQCEEACGETRDALKIDPNYRPSIYSSNAPLIDVKERKYYGMASEQGQIDISGGCTKNPEGIETWVPIDNTLSSFKFKFEAALRSTMSYVGAHNLQEFRTKTKYDIQSMEEFKSYYK